MNHNIINKIIGKVWGLTYDSVMSHLLHNFKVIDDVDFHFRTIAYIDIMNLTLSNRCRMCSSTTFSNKNYLFIHMRTMVHFYRRFKKHTWLVDGVLDFWRDEVGTKYTGQGLFTESFKKNILDEYMNEDMTHLCTYYYKRDHTFCV